MQKFIACLFLVLCTGMVYLQEPVDSKLHEKCLYPTVLIIDSGSSTAGSAFVVRSEKKDNLYKNIAITAYHTIEGDGPFTLRYTKYKNSSYIDSQKDVPFYVFAMNGEHDLAVGVFETEEPMSIVELEFEHKLYIGTKVFHTGFGMMDDARVDKGEITQPSTHKPDSYKGTIRTNAYSIVGDSGGPLFLDKSYKAIGVCRAVRSLEDKQLLTHQAYFTDIKHLKTWSESQDNFLESVYNNKAKMPIMPFVKLKLQNYKYSFPQ